MLNDTKISRRFKCPFPAYLFFHFRIPLSLARNIQFITQYKDREITNPPPRLGCDGGDRLRIDVKTIKKNDIYVPHSPEIDINPSQLPCLVTIILPSIIYHKQTLEKSVDNLQDQLFSHPH